MRGHRTTGLAIAAALVMATAGCGGDDPRPQGSAATTPPSPTTAAAARPASRSAQRAELRELRTLAETYTHGLANHRWRTVCGTRSRKDLREFSRFGGSCERTMKAGFATRPGVELFKTVQARAVRIAGERAAIDLHQPRQARPALTLTAVRERGSWRLQDVPDDQAP